MDDTKKIFAAFLIVLFILIVVGVTLSRIASKKGNLPIIGGGALERALFPDRKVKEPTPAGKTSAQKQAKDTSNTVIIKKTTGGQGQTSNIQITPLPKKISGQQTTIPNQTSGNTTSTPESIAYGEQKGAVPQSIPSTGASTISLLFSFAGLGSGIYLKRKIG